MIARIPRWAGAVAVLIFLVAGTLLLSGGSDSRTVTAYFSRAVAIYPGSEVRILGVRVGEVTEIVPAGNSVRVEMQYDAEYDVPAEAKAVIVTPTLTADRFIQLTPAYTGGAVLADGAEISVENTGTPIELDRIYRSLSDLTTALGPNGVNADGTLDNVLSASADFLDGQGRRANTTIVNLSRALTTFGDGSGELFETVRALDQFAGALAADDRAVDSFMDNLGAVSTQLAGEKDELFGALDNLARVLGKVERFVRDNRALLVSNIENLTTVTGVLAEEQEALKKVLEVGPSAMGNLVTAFDPYTGSIGSRINVGPNVATADDLLCSLVQNGGMQLADQACALFKTLLAPLRTQGEGNARTAKRASAAQAPEAAPAEGTAVQTRFGETGGADDLGQLLGGAG